MQLHSRPLAKPTQVLHDEVGMRCAFTTGEIRWLRLHVTVEEPSDQRVLHHGESPERRLRTQLATQRQNACELG